MNPRNTVFEPDLIYTLQGNNVIPLRKASIYNFQLYVTWSLKVAALHWCTYMGVWIRE